MAQQSNDWRVWERNPGCEETLLKRASGELPAMESAKQLTELVREVYRPGMTLLDMGCGPAHYYHALSTIDPGLKYTGCDATVPYIEHAKKVYEKNPHVTLKVVDIFELDPSKVGTFDIVDCCNVIIHLPDFRRPIANLLRVTKQVCIIRTLIGEKTTIVRRVENDEFDENGEPKNIIYQNTYTFDLLKRHILAQGEFDIELIEDKFNPDVLNQEHQKLKKGQGTRVVGGLQADANILFEWKWLRIRRR